jgi:glycosyltransferase involved in cell wall biosynthesis
MISVIVPTYRRPRLLWRALASVGAQTYPAVEVVVVNDGGPDAGHVVARYATTFWRPARYVALERNRGPAAARNAGAAVACGALLALLDDDDRYLPDHLARLAALLAAHDDAVLAYDDVLIQLEEGGGDDPDARVVATGRFGRPYDKAIFDRDDFIVPSATLLRRADFEAVGGFDEALPRCEDWEFLLRLRERGALRYAGSAVGVYYSQRVSSAEASSHLGSQFDARRRAVLDHLAACYGLPYLVPKTFLDVARDLGFALHPLAPGDPLHPLAAEE